MKLGLPTGQLGGARGWAAVLPGPVNADLALAVGATGVARHQSLPLTEVRRQVDLREQQIVTAVRAEQVWLHVVSLPATDPKELRQMLELQLDTLSPLPVEELVCGFEPLSRTPTATRLLVGFARKSDVNERVTALEEQDLPASVVSVDVLAVFHQYRQPADGKLQALVYVTETATSVVVYGDESPLQVRSLVAGEQAKVVDELRRALLGAQAATGTAEMGAVTFLADSEARRGAVEALGGEWGLGAVVAVAGKPLASDLCLAAAGAGARLNLLPDEWRDRRRSAGRRQLLLRVAVGVGVLYLVALVAALVLIAWRQSQVTQVALAIQQQRPAHDSARELRSTLMAMQGQLDTKYSVLEVLRTISELMPDSVKLTGLNFKKEQNVSLRGQTPSAVMANDFIGRLEKNALFASVKTVSVRTEGNLTKFEVVCSLKSAATAAPATRGPK